MVHIPIGLKNTVKNVLILGGGDGCIARELLVHPGIEKITLVDLDETMLALGKNNPIFTNLNNNALNNAKVTTIAKDAFTFLEETSKTYDLILVDLPDPNNVDINKLYTKEFYYLCRQRLTEKGVFITQSGSPYYATKAFYCIEKTMRAGGFFTLPLHNQILTLGEWSWIIGTEEELPLNALENLPEPPPTVKWLTKGVIPALAKFGKPLVDTTGIKINTIFTPKLYTYYKEGNWELY
jgi:spermidine synthase